MSKGFVNIGNIILRTFYTKDLSILANVEKDTITSIVQIFNFLADFIGTNNSEGVVENSYIADGCLIEGKVINSILFRGVKIGKNTVVENAILMQDTMVENDVNLNYIITDKNVTIRSRQTVSGCKNIPYYIGKNIMV